MLSLSLPPAARLALCCLLAGPMLAAAPAGAATYAGDAAKSRMAATFKMSGVPVTGQFKKFGGTAQFDPANPAQTRAQFDVDTASLDLGEPDYNAELAKKAWFDAARYPKATFVSTAVTAPAPGRLDVTGRLTIKGKSADLRFPVAYRQDGAAYVFEGAIPIKRLAFDIGEGEWKDTGVLENDVAIQFKLTLIPRK